MTKKMTLKKCASPGCSILIEVLQRTPAGARRFCSKCMAEKRARGCIVCGAEAGNRKELTWFKGAYYCDKHINPHYEVSPLRTRRCSSLGTAL